MIRKFSLLLVGAIMGATAMTALQVADTSAEASNSDTYRSLSLFGDIFERVRSKYVTPPEVDKLVENAINGMLNSLDPHSGYMNLKDADDMRRTTDGEFGGLGIEVTMENELVKVITPIADTPADEAGIVAGDLITEIDGDAVRGLTLTQAVEKMRGLVNTKINLTIIRKGADDLINIEITRAKISIQAVKYRVEDDIGYMRVISFTKKTIGDLENAVKKINAENGEENIKGFVLDLRLNPGGILDQAISVSDAFLNRGEIVSTRGRNPEETRRFDSRPGDITGGKPVIVMINGGSASASEIVAGALQDHKRATILGTTSFGKGSVQTIMPLGKHGALRLTTALYYTPSGKSIQGIGIEPDIIVEQSLPEELQGKLRKTGESKLRGHIQGKEETEKGSGSFAYVPRDPKKDEQLTFALALLRGEKTDPAFPPNPDQAAKE